MAAIGWAVALVFAVALAVIGGLMAVGGQQALYEELRPGFRSRPPRPLEGGLILAAVYLPLALVVLFIILTVGRIVEMIL